MNDYNEKVLKEALQKIAEAEDNEFLKEIEMAKNMPEYQLKDGEAKEFVEKNMPKKSNSKKMLLRVASIFVAVAVCFSAVTLSVDGFREHISEFVNNLSCSISASIKLSDNEDDAKLSSFEGQYVPTYIPEGYKVDEVLNLDVIKSITFSNKYGKTIIFSEQASDVKLNVDTENADSVENVDINGEKGLLITKDGGRNLVFTTDTSVINIACTDTEVNIVAFAQKVEKR